MRSWRRSEPFNWPLRSPEGEKGTVVWGSHSGHGLFSQRNMLTPLGRAFLIQGGDRFSMSFEYNCSELVGGNS